MQKSTPAKTIDRDVPRCHNTRPPTYKAHATGSMRYSTAAIISQELESAIAIADQRLKRESPARVMKTLISQNVAIQTGICAQRIEMIALTPAPSLKRENGANRYHASGKSCSQKSRYVMRPSAIQPDPQ